MPQFWLGDFAPQLFWLAISFILMYFLMARIALPRLGDILEDRQNRIAGDIDQAEQLKAEAEKVIADYEAALAEARAKAQTTIAEMTQRLTEEADQKNEEINAKLAAEADAAAERIAAAKAEAMAEVQTVATDLAQAIVEKMTGEAVDNAAISGAVDTALQEVN